MSSKQPAAKPYHHGDLREALLNEAERILETYGIQALTLRAAARAIGVSHTAPRNHFGDLTGLLSELAADGYRRFAKALTDAEAAAGTDPRERLHALGRAYIRFAADHPGLFTLMFRSDQLDHQRPALREAMAPARAALTGAVMARTDVGDTTLSKMQVAKISALRALAHGYAVLMLDQGLSDLLVPETGTDPIDLFETVLDSVTIGSVT
jgi:AcrR family transcriptional regulator